MTADDDPKGPRDTGLGPSRLRAVRGPVAAAEPPPPVHLWREFKGPTVADLLRDEFVARLPGQVRAAAHHLERGDYAAAERALPGEFAPVLAGPGHRRQARHLLVSVLAVVAALTGAALVAWLAS